MSQNIHPAAREQREALIRFSKKTGRYQQAIKLLLTPLGKLSTDRKKKAQLLLFEQASRAESKPVDETPPTSSK